MFYVFHELFFLELVDGGQVRLHSYDVIMINLSQFKDLSVRQVKGSMEIRYGVREVHLGSRLAYALLTTNQNILVIDLVFQDISKAIRRNAYPRTAKLSSCQRFFIASFSDNAVLIYDTRSGQPIQKIIGIPRGASIFLLSGNSRRMFFANNHTLCLWSVPKGELELASAQWKNINCYAMDSEGKKLALGTYSGAIVVLTMITATKVSEMQLKRHKSCVMVIAFSGNQILSVSYDKIMLITTIETNALNEKSIMYSELQLQSVPRGIIGIFGIPHLIENQGLFWIVQGNKMRGFSEGLYYVSECEGVIYILRYYGGKVEWFRR